MIVSKRVCDVCGEEILDDNPYYIHYGYKVISGDGEIIERDRQYDLCLDCQKELAIPLSEVSVKLAKAIKKVRGC